MFQQGGWGQWVVYYTRPQSFKITLYYSMNKVGNNLSFDWLVHEVDLQQPRIVMHRRGYFVYHHWDVHQFICNCLINLDPC